MWTLISAFANTAARTSFHSHNLEPHFARQGGPCMDPIETANAFVDSARSSIDLPSLSASFQRSLESIGFRYFACGSHVDPLHPERAIMLLNYPREWVELYSERKLHCLDPVFLFSDRMGVPFLWDSD